jgi:hypothetical protein
MAKSTAPRKNPAKKFEDQLARYREMRDFNVTAEPRGSKGAIQKVPREVRSPLSFKSMLHRICTTTSAWLGMAY